MWMALGFLAVAIVAGYVGFICGMRYAAKLVGALPLKKV